jgi:CRP-like cAMP-binding protein
MAFGLIIATVGIIVETLDPEVTARKKKMDELKGFLLERGVSKQLQRQVKDHYEYFFTRHSVFPEANLFSELPNSLLIKLVFEVRKEELNVVTLFNQLETMCIVDLINKLKPFQLNYMQTLGGYGEVSTEMYFVVKGKIEALCLTPEGMAVCGLFKEGDDMEIDSILGDQIMRATYRAISVTDLLWVEAEDLLDSIEEYPEGRDYITSYKNDYELRMSECINSKTIVDHSSAGLVKSKVYFRRQVKSIDDLADEFELASADSNLTKIRTYRKVVVENTRR